MYLIQELFFKSVKIVHWIVKMTCYSQTYNSESLLVRELFGPIFGGPGFCVSL